MQILDGHKEIMGGNKRFIEGRTIKPRQDMNTIKKACRQEPLQQL
jgi:hypothetical protein